MIENTFQTSPHRRWNPLKREWVIVSPHRTKRPWQGQKETPTAPVSVFYDPECYLCPGNTRFGGKETPEYSGPYVFENDFPALLKNVPREQINLGDADLLLAQTESGCCRVLCFDPRHDLTLATMDLAAIRRVVDMWAAQTTELGACADIEYVQVFENRGAMMGASNPHPHCQIWATEHLPNDPAIELAAQQRYFADHKTQLLTTYLQLEVVRQERVVVENDTWVALVPFWAVWPFEMLLLPKQNASRVEALNESQRDGLASILKRVTNAYNDLFDTPFPYSMGLHPAPADGKEHPEWLLHLHFFPPLLRSANIRKFMVGFELLGSPQRDITPESAASTLRALLEDRAHV